MQVYFRGLDVSFLRFVLVLWVSKKWSKPTNTKSGYKFSQISAGLKVFSFSQAWKMLGVGVRHRAGDEKWEKRSREAERQREWEMEREIDIEMQERQRERDWEVGRKCDLVWVFWAPCSICPPLQRGRVTGIGRNWISRLNTPSSSSSLFPSPLLCPSPPLFFSSPPILPFHWRGKCGGDCRQRCSCQVQLRSLCHR